MAEKPKNLLTEEQISKIAKLADDQYDFKKMKNKFVGSIIEAVDDDAARITLRFFNNRVSGFIPDEYKDEIQVAIDDVLDGDADYSQAIVSVVDIAQSLQYKMDAPPFVKSLTSSFILLIESALLALNEKD